MADQRKRSRKDSKEILVPGRSKGVILPLSFYARDTTQVARDLLGKRLVHLRKGRRLSGIIVETEAYIGVEDPACHSFSGRRTKRNETMYAEAGTAYVYLIYGMHFCFNVVTQKKNCPEAVLIRALQPDENPDLQMRNRLRKSKSKSVTGIASGPGKLCAALGIERSDDGEVLNGNKIWIEDVGLTLSSDSVVTASRIGVAYAGEAAEWPLRFYVKNHRDISQS